MHKSISQTPADLNCSSSAVQICKYLRFPFIFFILAVLGTAHCFMTSEALHNEIFVIYGGLHHSLYFHILLKKVRKQSVCYVYTVMCLMNFTTVPGMQFPQRKTFGLNKTRCPFSLFFSLVLPPCFLPCFSLSPLF